MDPGSSSGFALVKDNFVILETILAVGTPEPESHPIILCGSALRDLVPAVDHLATREAHELELALAARLTFHSPLCCSSSLESKFTSGGDPGEHFVESLVESFL
tara:strand:- start:681 stop:992 length:312 start_codon:yes stop_codon:yes gene_type:complete